MATAADGLVEGGVLRREGARARRERRQRAEARLRLRLVRDAERLVAHRGGPRFQSKFVREAAPPQGLREVVQPSPLPQVSLVNCHAPSLAVPQLVEAEEHLQAGVAMFQRLWIVSRVVAWKSYKSVLRAQHVQYKRRLSQARVAGEFVVEGELCPLDVANVHDVDGLGTPLYSNFVCDDWSSCRGELRSTLLHMVSSWQCCPRVFEMVSGRPLDTTQLNAQTLDFLEEPVQVISGPGSSMFLVSRFSPEVDFDEFVRGVESF